MKATRKPHFAISRAAALFLTLTILLALPCPGSARSAVRAADIMMVLDLSGSMKARGGARRYEALFEWMKSFASPEDRIGVVAMGYGARLVSPLTAYDSFSMDAVRNALVQREKFTDVAAGLESAYYQLRVAPSSERDRIILLYSDAQIDMPGGEWESRHSMQYLLENLKPSLKSGNIRLVAVVPEGLKANFQLLHELSTDTQGAYHRGIPEDAVAFRASLVLATTASSAAPAVLSTQPAAADPLSVATPASRSDLSAAAPTAAKAGDATPEKVIVERVVTQGTSGWIVAIFAVFGVAILAMFGFVLYMFRSNGPKKENETELTMALKEVQSLQQLTAKRRVRRDDTGAIDGTALNPELVDPSEELSASLVSPFLDFEDAHKHLGKGTATDDIAAQPAFSSVDDAESNLSISTMETLIGTVAEDAENRNE